MDGLLNYGRNHWQQLLKAYMKALGIAKPNFFDKFDTSWVANQAICTRNNTNISWTKQWPTLSLFS